MKGRYLYGETISDSFTQRPITHAEKLEKSGFGAIASSILHRKKYKYHEDSLRGSGLNRFETQGIVYETIIRLKAGIRGLSISNLPTPGSS